MNADSALETFVPLCLCVLTTKTQRHKGLRISPFTPELGRSPAARCRILLWQRLIKGVGIGFAKTIPGNGGRANDSPVGAAGGPGNASFRVCRFHHSDRNVLRSNTCCRS